MLSMPFVTSCGIVWKNIWPVKIIFCSNNLQLFLPSVQWSCWFGDGKGIRHVKSLSVGIDLVVIPLELFLSESSTCTTGIFIILAASSPVWFAILVPAYGGSLEYWQLNRDDELSNVTYARYLSASRWLAGQTATASWGLSSQRSSHWACFNSFSFLSCNNYIVEESLCPTLFTSIQVDTRSPIFRP